jgi:hypothetical protein
MQQKRILPNNKLKTWEVDVEVLKSKFKSHAWLKNEKFLKRDIEEMSQYLPHWIITVGNGINLLHSKCCSDNLAPIEGELRCILCNRPSSETPNTLTWTGLLPVGLEGYEKAFKKLEKARAEGKLKYPIIIPNNKRHLLVPMMVVYPSNWPYSPPQVHYVDNQYIDALKLPSNHQTHLGGRTICLYHAAQWNDNTSIMQVIANRVAPHLLALLKLSNDQENFEFFNTSYGYY